MPLAWPLLPLLLSTASASAGDAAFGAVANGAAAAWGVGDASEMANETGELLLGPSATGDAAPSSLDRASLRRKFDAFKTAFRRSYDSEDEEALRLRSFEASVRSAAELNRQNGASVFGINQLSDLNEEELAVAAPKGLTLRDVHGLRHRLPVAQQTHVWADFTSPAPKKQYGRRKALSQPLPPAIDWRRAGAVTPVKTQGACGDCWAFSVAQEVESMYSIHADDLLQTFSAQQVTSCTTESFGCGGGDPIDAYMYLMRSEGLAQEAFWPFAGGLTPSEACNKKECTQACNAKDLNILTRYRLLIGPYAVVKEAFFALPPCQNRHCRHQDLRLLASALVKEGPLSTVVNANVWHSYKGGVLTYAGCGNTSMESMNHAVQLVGFNTTGKVPYWIVRNTWSTLWGEHGYIYLEYPKNTCGIGNLAVFARVSAGGRDEAGADGEQAWGRHRRLEESREERFKRLYRAATGQDQDAVDGGDGGHR